MNVTQFPIPPEVSLIIGLIIIFTILSGVIFGIYKISLRINKFESPKSQQLLSVAFLQILSGIIVMILLWVVKFGPVAGIGTGIGVIVLSGFPVLKWLLHRDWKWTIRLWGVAAVLQFIVLPICGIVLMMIWVMFFVTIIYPPVSCLDVNGLVGI